MTTNNPAQLSTTAERVDHICGLMVRGTWSHLAARELAAAWGVSARRVRALSAEAHRRVTEDQTSEDKDELRGDLTSRLMTWAAMDAANGDRVSATKHLELVAKLNGLFVTRADLQVQEEARAMLLVAKEVLPREHFLKFLAALAAKGHVEEAGHA